MLAPGTRRPAGDWDRCRVGERLSAALAGLQELQVLRDKQQALVRGALALQPPPPRATARDPRSKEHRLEATLAALKEQLSRLRRQDAGLKTHLDQLDQQISELQLDVQKTATEPPDSDSRPSSGFYDLSDGGSCSLSTSCTSVSNDSISSSLSSLLPTGQPTKARLGVGDNRPKSADETTVQAACLPPRRPSIMEGGRPQGSPQGAGRPLGKVRPRPVSTGDLERVVTADTELQKANADPQSNSVLCHGINIESPMVDPKYQSDLVSKSGKEVYPYPSPLHAVALQSPLFAVTKETVKTDRNLPLGKLIPGTSGPNLICTRPVFEARPTGTYIHKLLQLARGQGRPSRDSVGEQGSLKYESSASQQRHGGQRRDGEGQLEKLVCSPERKEMDSVVQRGTTDGDHLRQQGSVSLVDTQQPIILPEEFKPSNSCVLGKTTVGFPWPACELDPSACPQAQPPHTAVDGWEGRATLASGKEDNMSPSQVAGQFARAQSVASEAYPVRLKMGNSKVKAMKIKRRTSDKLLRFGKQPSPLPERQGAVHAVHWLPTEWNPSHRPHGSGGLRRRPAFAREAPGRSCSESSLYPVPFFVPLVMARREGYRASANALYPFEAAHLNMVASGGTRKKQRKCQSTVEISAKAHLASFPANPGLGPPRLAVRRAGGLRLGCTRGRPKPPCHGSYARSESDRSEFSAECASLFHSTIVETSEEEVSDYTANRFGDKESSDSDSEGCGQSSGSSFSLDWEVAGGGELMWPPVAQQPPRAQVALKPSLPSVPKLCRIKASKALKKKIRRFQPAALKVMTMV
ncbi:dapper homolog 2 [Choloepus didactylus]|uniref:dapper homolog 2 n=1 Tax=Choloepus didactylus TaxID=27675 RepID=UPI00189D28AB|nr:dapper homolog 2 [Choloepus didactylus]